jgi:NTP pyrophosphatase (non-canonical NTP hydrolase)
MKVIRCDESCKHKGDRGYCFGCRQLDKWEENKQSIEFKRINGLTPTVESCTMKLLEEVGELMQLLGKGHRLNGESELTVEQQVEKIDMRTVEETLDVAQSAVTMAYVLCDKHGIDISMMMMDHIEKLYDRGYLK